jgi:hypothetical protein
MAAGKSTTTWVTSTAPPYIANQPHYGNRYVKTTGYDSIADSNDIVVLYVQEEGSDGGASSHTGVAHPRHAEPAWRLTGSTSCVSSAGWRATKPLLW